MLIYHGQLIIDAGMNCNRTDVDDVVVDDVDDDVELLGNVL